MRYLFIRFSSLGDTVLTTGVIKKFAELNPDAHIEVLTCELYKQVFSGLSFISAVNSVKSKIKLLEYIAFLKTLPQFDYIIDFHCNVRSYIAAALISHNKTMRCRKQVLARRLYVKFRLMASKLSKHTVQRYAECILKPLPPIVELKPYIDDREEFVEGRVVVHPFASNFTKMWPYFGELISELEKEYDVLVVGNGDIAHKIAETPTIEALIKVIKSAELVITNDSGPMHLAVALGVPVMAIFGGTVKQLGFYPIFSDCTVLENELPCRPCHIHGFSKCPRGHFKCMREISVQTVYEAAKKILS
jgi:ADP-heptose:LPS heptosyltransferase